MAVEVLIVVNKLLPLISVVQHVALLVKFDTRENGPTFISSYSQMIFSVFIFQCNILAEISTTTPQY